MNKLALILIVASIALSSLITYQITQSGPVGLSDEYVKKENLKKYFDEYVDQGSDVIYASLVKAIEQQKQADEKKKQQALIDHKEELENDPLTPFLGNEKGDVNIVMFSDYQCGYCKKSAPILSRMLQKDTGLKLILKEYPVLGQASLISAKAALAAFKLDKAKYAVFNQQLFKRSLRSENDLLAIAKAADINGLALLAEMKKPEYVQQLQKNQTLGSKLGINGTPAFIIDNVLYAGALPEAQLLEIIKTVREKRSVK